MSSLPCIKSRSQKSTHLICKSYSTWSTYLSPALPDLPCCSQLASAFAYLITARCCRPGPWILDSPVRRLQKSLRSPPHLLQRQGCVLTDVSSGVHQALRIGLMLEISVYAQLQIRSLCHLYPLQEADTHQSQYKNMEYGI